MDQLTHSLCVLALAARGFDVLDEDIDAHVERLSKFVDDWERAQAKEG